ncbi:hypothetical protein HAX54_019285 [Datura stramonium]|uniref:RNase H type-1 domain-containing protein n=1 Tax=Datura stramonium TaxID=4076 RepID=A0ABS8UR83_DATST|nr:hypothetical protein [Datura stramonium]
MDSAIIKDMISRSQNINQKLYTIIEDIKQILTQANATTSNCYREANLVGDALAKNTSKKAPFLIIIDHINDKKRIRFNINIEVAIGDAPLNSFKDGFGFR